MFPMFFSYRMVPFPKFYRLSALEAKDVKGPTGTTASLAREGVYMRCRGYVQALLVDN